MTVKLVTNRKIAETSSKGNQEKWYEPEQDAWYKLDQFGYEALAETTVSKLLERSNIEREMPFVFVRYEMERLQVRGRERTGCVSQNFLKPGQNLITLAKLLKNHWGVSVSEKLQKFSSDKKRIAYLAEATAEITGLKQFPAYLTMLFEIDALFCNDDRHLNNIAVIEENGRYAYCPIFDHGAGLLSNMIELQMDVEPKALISLLKAQPFGMTFNRQRNTARALYGQQLQMPLLTAKEIREIVEPFLEYYPIRDRAVILKRVTECILLRQKA